VKRKPARKPAKKRRAAEVQGVPLPGGGIQWTIFPVVRRPDDEVRIEQDGEVLAGQIPPAILDELWREASSILADVQRWEMDRSVEDLPLHPVSGKPRTKVNYSVEESVLKGLVEQIAVAAFQVAAARYSAEIAALVARLNRRVSIREQRQENGKILHAKGQVILSKKTAENDRILCKLYRSVRESFPPDGRGNTAALDVVRVRHQQKTNRDRPVDRKTVRNALKRCGILCQ
jgi:hypothetical protein